ncbi:MAG: hypothetical protein C4562_03490 [Actinobacteria bacterium]|nr:MAG: hypothetical protein C4562_03490 [Actinomycetota bacterium]
MKCKNCGTPIIDSDDLCLHCIKTKRVRGGSYRPDDIGIHKRFGQSRPSLEEQIHQELKDEFMAKGLSKKEAEEEVRKFHKRLRGSTRRP